MPIYQRGKNKIWFIDFYDKNGGRIRQSSGTQVKQEAQELHDKLKAQAWRVNELGAKPRHTWNDAVVRWICEQEHKKSLKDDKGHFRYLHTFLNDRPLDEISKTMIDKIKAEKQKTGASNATVNRVLALLRSVLNRSRDEWEWLDTVPKIRLLQEPKQRIRWLKQEEVNVLLGELPGHLNVMGIYFKYQGSHTICRNNLTKNHKAPTLHSL